MDKRPHSKDAENFISKNNLKPNFKTTEEFLFTLLYNFTKQTYYKTTKEYLGECFKETCCFNTYLPCNSRSTKMPINKCITILEHSYVSSILKGVLL